MIPSDRTAVPVEWDEVKTQLMRLATDLGPKNGVSAPRCPGSSTAPPTPWTATATSCARPWPNSPASARIFADGSGNIVDIIKNLQMFVTALRDSKEQIVQFQNRLATLTSVLDDNRSDLDAALTNLSVAVGEVQRFVAGTRDQTGEQIAALANVTQILVDHQMALRERPAHRAERDRELLQHLLPERRLGDRGVPAVNFANPVWFFCGMIGAVENTTAPETAKLCAQYLGPAMRLLNVNNIPFPINPFLRPAIPGPGHLHRPEARAGRCGPRRSARTAADGFGLHRARRYSAAAGPGRAARPCQGFTRPTATTPAIPSPALYPGAPIPGPPNVMSNLPAGAARRRDAAPPAAPAQPMPPNAPLLPAEGTPPS